MPKAPIRNVKQLQCLRTEAGIAVSIVDLLEVAIPNGSGCADQEALFRWLRKDLWIKKVPGTEPESTEMEKSTQCHGQGVVTVLGDRVLFGHIRNRTSKRLPTSEGGVTD